MTLIIKYPLDPTGVSVNNLVSNELCQLSSDSIRCIAPLNGAFYGTSMVIIDLNTNQTLNSSQWYPSELYDVPTALYGKAIYGIAVITDNNVSTNISISYQAVGGEFSTQETSIVQLANTLALDSRPVQWPNVFNTPLEYPPSEHLHDAGTIYGFEYVVHAIERVRAAIDLGDTIAQNKFYKYIDSKLSTVNTMADLQTLVNSILLAAGLSVNGQYIVSNGSTYLGEAGNLSMADSLLDTAIANEVTRAIAAEAGLTEILNGFNTQLANLNTQVNAAILEINNVAASSSNPAFSILIGFSNTIGSVSSNDTILSALEKLSGNFNATNSSINSINSEINSILNLPPVINNTLTGFVSSAGTVTASDSLLSALEKINGNVAAINSAVNSLSPISATLTGYASTTGALSANDTILTAIEKLNGNIAAEATNFTNAINTVNTNVNNLQTALATAQSITFNNQTVINYTTILTDATFTGQNGNFLTFNNAAPQTVTIAANANVPYPIGASIQISQLGTGKVTFVGDTNVTINSNNNLKSIGGQFISVSLLQTSIDNWLLVGDIIA